MLTLLVFAALLSFAGAVLLPWLVPLAPAAHVHLALAVGVMPLIMGAMAHFIPVLTRSGAPARGIGVLPWLASMAGILAFLAFAAPAFAAYGYLLGALLGLIAALSMGVWMQRRGAASLGSPHPCLYWYLAAIGCLGLALLAVLAMELWPQQRPALRLFHLHLNTVGFVGLTAVGTLQVLLPTAAGRPDKEAARRLRTDLKWAFGGTLLIAAGAAWFHPLVWPGLVLWLIPLLRLARAWWALFRQDVFRRDGATPSLGAALAGLSAVLLFGAAHAAGVLNAVDTAHTYVLAFLFPLVTGAVSQLLPVWMRPGPQTDWHRHNRQRLVRWGGIRALLFLAGGTAVGIGWRWGLVPAVAGLALFLAQTAAVLLLKRG